MPLLLSEVVATHTMVSSGLSTASLTDNVLHTVQAVDLYGNPFLNLTFALPESAIDIWDGAAVRNPGDEAFTVITGARTIHDVLIAYSHDLRLLEDLQATVRAIGGASNLGEIVGATANNLLVRDASGSLWDVATKEELPEAQVDRVLSNYAEIVTNNNTQAFIDEMQAHWDQFEQQILEGQAAYGYDLKNLGDDSGGLDLQAVNAVETQLAPMWFIDHGRRCAFLGMFCSHRYQGGISSGDQATQGGSLQERSDYGMGSTPVAFNSIACGVNNPVNDLALLGCGPSAFIGLLGRKFQSAGASFDGTNAGNTSLNDFRKWLVAEIGVNNRPRIAEYMGTCVLGTAYEGFTTIAGFTNGAQDFLNQTGSGLTLKYRAGIGGATGFDASAAATMIHLQVGVTGNPVVATYWPTAATAHYAPIAEYDIMWGNGVAINVRTTDGGPDWYGISSHWSGQIGVYYLE